MATVDMIERDKCRAIYAAARRKAEVKGIDPERMAAVGLAESLVDLLKVDFDGAIRMGDPVLKLTWELAKLSEIARAIAEGAPAEIVEAMRQKRREDSKTSGLAKMGVSLELAD